MVFLEQYWDSVLRRLQAEVDGFNRLIGHQGERGRENELALARILEPLVPARYAVGTGLLIDSADQASKQCDVVLYDQADQPRLLAQTSQLLHPVETVRAVVEVKTTLDSEEIKDASEKKASIDRLHSTRASADGERHPLFLLFAYAANTSPATIAANLYALAPDKRPHLTCLINPGLVAGDPRYLSVAHGENGGDYVAGATPLLGRDGKPVQTDRLRRQTEHEGGLYPVLPHGDGYALGHPARALLLFTDGLLRGLAAREGASSSISGTYISGAARSVAAYKRQESSP